MNIMLKDTKYTRTVRALRNFVMMVLPLFFLALTGCRNEEDIPERLSGEDDVTVRLNLSTRGVTIPGMDLRLRHVSGHVIQRETAHACRSRRKKASAHLLP